MPFRHSRKSHGPLSDRLVSPQWSGLVQASCSRCEVSPAEALKKTRYRWFFSCLVFPAESSFVRIVTLARALLFAAVALAVAGHVITRHQSGARIFLPLDGPN